MAGFIDVYLPSTIPGYPCVRGPRTSTTITELASGDEGRNRNWAHPKRKFQLPAADARKDFDRILDLEDHFLILDGPANSFPLRDPHDYASVRLAYPNEPAASVLARLTAEDQPLGTGDGVTRAFPLGKAYTRGGQTYLRSIGLPVIANLLIADNGTPTSAYTVTRPGGVVTFTVAPTAGHTLTWGGLFDTPVRFESDDALMTVVKSYQVSGFAQVTFVETRLC